MIEVNVPHRAQMKQWLRDTTIDTAKAVSDFTGYDSTIEVDGALIQAETQDVRVRNDGTAPTTTSGTLVKAGAEGLVVFGPPSNIKVISATAGAAATVTLFKSV